MFRECVDVALEVGLVVALGLVVNVVLLVHGWT